MTLLNLPAKSPVTLATSDVLDSDVDNRSTLELLLAPSAELVTT